MKISSKTIKVLSMLLVILMCIVTLSTVVFAATTNPLSPIDIEGDISTEAAVKVQSISGQILGIVQVVGVAVAVIMLIVLAIKYISAAPNDKAEIKKHAVVYVTGAVILFAAAGLLEIIKGLAEQF